METPGAEGVHGELGTQLAGIHIERRPATLSQGVALRFLFEVCKRETWCEGGGKMREAWWLQESSEKQILATVTDSQKAKRSRIVEDMGKQ